MIADSSLYSFNIFIILSIAFFFSKTIRFRFFLLKLEINIFGYLKDNCFNISTLTFSVAVAVKAIIGDSGNIALSDLRFLYSGRKSCPHSEMQCASSIAIKLTFNMLKNILKSYDANLSGAI